MAKQVAVLAASLLLTAQLAAGSIFDLLYRPAAADEFPVTEVTLELPLDSIYAKTINEQSAVLTFTDTTGLAQRWPLHVDVRGKFRRRICTFPPLKLNFSKKSLKAAGLEKFDKLKLVTPCQEDEAGDDLILREYLTYRLYHQLSPFSFRVQLLRITYRDANGNHPDQTRYAFILEDNDEMAARLGGEELEADSARGISPERLNRQAEISQALFAYLISNTDWNLNMVRNLKLVGLDDGTVIPVPYDFDFSAVVNAPYARPSNALGQYSIKQRVYLGFQASDVDLLSVIEHFTAQRKAIFRTVRQFKLLPLDQRQEILFFLDSFYVEVKDTLRMHADQPAYFALRSVNPELVPPGANPAYYGVSRK